MNLDSARPGARIDPVRAGSIPPGRPKERRVHLGGLPVERLHAAGRALARAKLPATSGGATKAR
jgi:hypothetical protein